MSILKVTITATIIGLACGPAYAQSSAQQQLKKANEGEKQRGQVYDGRADKGTVRADPAPKPSQIGTNSNRVQPYRSSAAPVAVPSPTRTETLNRNRTNDPTIQRALDKKR